MAWNLNVERRKKNRQFGDGVESTNIAVPDEVHRVMEELARISGRSVEELYVTAIQRYTRPEHDQSFIDEVDQLLERDAETRARIAAVISQALVASSDARIRQYEQTILDELKEAKKNPGS